MPATPSICAFGEGESAGDETFTSTPFTLWPAAIVTKAGVFTGLDAGAAVGVGAVAVAVVEEEPERLPPQLISNSDADVNDATAMRDAKARNTDAPFSET
jgi:hypothetical protein